MAGARVWAAEAAWCRGGRGGGLPLLPHKRVRASYSGGLWMGSQGLSMVLFYYLFTTEVYNCLGKGLIYCDIRSEVLTTSVN